MPSVTHVGASLISYRNNVQCHKDCMCKGRDQGWKDVEDVHDRLCHGQHLRSCETPGTCSTHFSEHDEHREHHDNHIVICYTNEARSASVVLA